MIISRKKGERIKQIAQVKANPTNPRRIFKKYNICCIRFFVVASNIDDFLVLSREKV